MNTQQFNEQIESYKNDIARMQKANANGSLDEQIQAWGEIIDLIKLQIKTKGVADRINAMCKAECAAISDIEEQNVILVAYQAAIGGVLKEIADLGGRIEETLSYFTVNVDSPSVMDRLLTRTGEF